MTESGEDAGVSDGTRIFWPWHRFAWLVRSLGGECHNSATVVGVPRRSTRIGAERENWQRLLRSGAMKNPSSIPRDVSLRSLHR